MASRVVITAMAAGLVLMAATAADAQNRQQGQGQRQQQSATQQRQMERAADHDRTMSHQRLQARDRDRTQDRAHVEQAKAGTAPGQGIYGGNLMTVEERNQYRERLGSMTTVEERKEFEARHREEMQTRARQRDLPVEVTNE